jgi:hypothetical protein
MGIGQACRVMCFTTLLYAVDVRTPNRMVSRTGPQIPIQVAILTGPIATKKQGFGPLGVRLLFRSDLYLPCEHLTEGSVD